MYSFTLTSTFISMRKGKKYLIQCQLRKYNFIIKLSDYREI